MIERRSFLAALSLGPLLFFPTTKAVGGLIPAGDYVPALLTNEYILPKSKVNCKTEYLLNLYDHGLLSSSTLMKGHLPAVNWQRKISS